MNYYFIGYVAVIDGQPVFNNIVLDGNRCPSYTTISNRVRLQGACQGVTVLSVSKLSEDDYESYLGN